MRFNASIGPLDRRETEETWSYCFNGIPTNSVVAIGTVGGSPRKLVDRKRFEAGLYKMVEVLRPHTIIVYACFDEAVAYD